MRENPSPDNGKRFQFGTSRCVEESLRAGPALGMALMRRMGIPDFVDDNCSWDRDQRIISPGNVLKAICGTMFTENPKQALNGIRGFYNHAPVDILFGDRADHSSLNDKALANGMRTMFDSDLEILMYSLASRSKALMNMGSSIYHIDSSNITIQRAVSHEYGEIPDGAPIPKLGHPKDGHTERLQYNFQSIVDGDGLLMYMKTFDGNVDDNTMFMDSVKFLERNLNDDRKIVCVADCKFVYKELIDRMVWNGMAFISKTPDNFAEHIRRKVIEKAMSIGFTDVGKIGKRKDSPEYEVCDLDMYVDGDLLRFLVYKKASRKATLDYYLTEGMRKVNKHLSKYSKKRGRRTFSCEPDAMSDFLDTVRKVEGLPFDISARYVPHEYVKKREGRGRPRKDDSPAEIGTYWTVEYEVEFNESRAKDMQSDRDLEVIITNIPRTDDTQENLADGGTTLDILKAYVAQWKIESIFGEAKSKLKADTVFFVSPEMEATMLFCVGVAMLVRGMMRNLMRMNREQCVGIPETITAMQAFRMVQNVTVRLNRGAGRVFLDGPVDECNRMMDLMQLLGIEPEELLG